MTERTAAASLPGDPFVEAPLVEPGAIGTAERLERERAFHDVRYEGGGDDRGSQLKYYAALGDCFNRYATRKLALASGRKVLEYGCGTGKGAIDLASQANACVAGIDISSEAIDAANRRAHEAAPGQAAFSVQNAEAMSFKNEMFDLVYGAGILHHLDYDKALDEIARVTTPGGRVLFIEPLGHNPLINLYRQLTPKARTVDEHPLTRKDILAFQRRFSNVRIRLYGLCTLGAVPLRNTAFFKPLYRVLAALDSALLSLPGFKWQAWYAVMEGEKSANPG